MKVWDSPFVPSHLTFKKFQFHSLSVNQSHNSQTNNQIYLFIITFQNLEFWDVTGRKQLEMKTRDICVIQRSKPSGGYIMNFYRPKYVSCKKMESGKRKRCPRGRGRAQGVGRALYPRGALVSFLDCFLFFYFSKYSKTEKYCVNTVLESVYLPYHILIPFRSLKRSGKCPLCTPLVLRYE